MCFQDVLDKEIEKLKEKEKVEFLQALDDFIEKNNLASSLEPCKDGMFLMLDNCRELERIEQFMKSKNITEMPISYGYRDEYEICDICHSVICITPSSAFYQPDWYRNNDGDIVCCDCIDVEDLIGLRENDVEKCIFKAQISEVETIMNLGYINFSQKINNERYSKNYENDYEKAMESYSSVVAYCEESTPFEADVIVLAK